MTVLINEDEKTVRISVGDLVRAVNDSIGIGGKNRLFAAQWGQQLHRAIAGQSAQNARSAEVHVSHSIQVNEYTVIIRGRIDLLLAQADRTLVQEIKTVTLTGKELEVASETDFPAFRDQLRLYLYLLDCTEEYEKISGQLILVSIMDGSVVELPITYDRESVFLYVRSALLRIIRDHQSLMLKKEHRRSLAGRIKLPFNAARRYQDEAAEAVLAALEARNNLLLSAPTGMGKTAAVLTSALQFALANDLRIFWASGKSSHQRIVAETLRLVLPDSAQFSAVFLMAKEKLCFNHSFNCDESVCPYSREFSAKVKDSSAVASLLQQQIIMPEDIVQSARESEVCPFELSLRVAMEADFIAGDYNYIFDPRSSLRRLFPRKKRKEWILIVDEAHNLYPRARNSFSSSLGIQGLKEAERLAADGAPPPGMLPILVELKKHVAGLRRAHRQGRSGKQRIELEKEFFSRIGAELEKCLPDYFLERLRAGTETSDDPLGDFLLDLSMFCKLLALEGDFAHVYDSSAGGSVEIICLDPSAQLKDIITPFLSVIAVSATLEPHEFFRDVLGFPPDETMVRSFPSPFHRESRKVLIVPAISTTYRTRSATAEQVARLILEVTALRKGNYAAFFPSFAYLNLVAAHLRDFPGRVVAQRGGMSEQELERTLSVLKEQSISNLILAVQGGSFAEGVDYAEHSLSGAFIVGVGLPELSVENELQRAHFDEKYGAGFQYAYLYPGMNRVIQSAGRIIRSERDMGFIMLIGKRYASPEYYSLLPRDWHDYSVEELISSDPAADIRDFWDEQER